MKNVFKILLQNKFYDNNAEDFFFLIFNKILHRRRNSHVENFCNKMILF